MPRGRKPTAKELRDLSGLKSSHPPFNPRGAKSKRPLGGPPGWMNELQKAIWREGIKSAPRGLLTVTDASIYTVWVMASYSLIRASQQFEEQGGQLVVSTVNGNTKANPLLTIIRQEATQMKAAASELGFTPTARMRVKAEDGDDEESNPFDAFGGTAQPASSYSAEAYN